MTKEIIQLSSYVTTSTWVTVKLEGDLIQVEGYCAAHYATGCPNRRIHLL